MNSPSLPTAFDRELIDFGAKIVFERDGEPVSAFQSILLAMRALMVKNPQLGTALLDKVLDASKRKDDFDTLVLQEAIAHKEQWTDEFALAERCGRPPPDVFPHPDDIVIGRDGRVRFIGPVTRADARQAQKLIELRENAFNIARDFINNTSLSIEVRRGAWEDIRRNYYRYSRFIPKRMKRPFPKFAPPSLNET